MKIAVIVPQVFDYLVASIIEGLENLNTDLMTSSQYFNKRYASSVVDFLDYANNANVIVLTSNQGVPVWFDNLTKNGTARFVYIDGSDQSLHFAPRDTKWSFIFKRELLRNDPTKHKRGIFPLPFGALDRWIYPPIQKSIFLSYLANRYNNPLRNLIHFELASYGRTDFLLGNTGESSNTGKLLIGNTHTYTQMLRNSLCSVSAPGAGFDCARFWENIRGTHTTHSV